MPHRVHTVPCRALEVKKHFWQSGRFFCAQKERVEKIGTRIAQIGIILEELSMAGRVNDALHEYSAFVVGRMGLPYRERGISIISVVLDAPEATISALAGKLGQIPSVSVKTMLAKVEGRG